MEKLAEQPKTEQYTYDREQRLYDDTTTWLAEALPGMMRTPFEYRFDGRELYARDGSGISPIFQEALVDAKRTAEHKPELAFEVRRRTIEAGELKDMLAMARGEAPNTMVVVSDFPPELMSASSDVGGYNVSRKQTMLRVISRSADGTLLMRSQSLDLSDRLGLEQLYSALGFEPQPGELLGQRMLLELPEHEQEFLTDKLMGVYDRTLSARYGGEYYAGRKHERRQNTYDFVRAQNDLIDMFVADSINGIDDQMLYDLTAAMYARFERTADRMPDSQVLGIFTGDVRQEMAVAGQAAASSGTVFSACGETLGASNRLSADAQGELGLLGFGNQAEQSAKLPPKIRCINCKENVSSKKVVKPKSWCCPSCRFEVDICSGAVINPGRKRKR